jgi:uncharacterized protein (TIGR00251 family)
VNPWYLRREDQLVLQLRIQPGARRTEVAGLHAGRLKLRIAAPPVDGKANQCLLDFLAEAFGVPRSQVALLGGETSRDKKVTIHAPRVEPPWLAAHLLEKEG